METPTMTAEIAWDEAIRDIPDPGLERSREATQQEREAVARVLDLLACPRLAVTYVLKPIDQNRFSLRGKLNALVEQTCVVTLEPMTTSIEEDFEATFVPPDEIVTPESGAVDIDDEMDPEPIVEGRITVGRIVFECLASAIDLFPRKPGAALAWQPGQGKDGTDAKADNPFAVLAKIKK